MKNKLIITSLIVCLAYAFSLTRNDKNRLTFDTINYDSLTVSINFKKKHSLIEGGYISGLIFSGDLLVGNDMMWSTDGSKASVAIEVTAEELKALEKTLINEFKKTPTIYTYSGNRNVVGKTPSLGIHTTQYFESQKNNEDISFRFSGVKGNYNRNKWISIPISQINEDFWNRVEKVFIKKKKFVDLIKRLQVFFKNNA
jgi:hypothetical protein